MSQKKEIHLKFEDLDLSENLLKQLHKLGFETPTPIQHKAIPAGLKGEDVIGIARTGTGKTLAFSIPMIQRMASGEEVGLIILPTRELALQVEEEVRKIGSYFGIKTAVLIGGASINPQKIKLRRKPNVIIATPGRLIDHIQQKTANLSKITYLVLDEADRMLDMGFEPQIQKILETVPKKRQTMLFSATMPDKISNIAKKYMKAPVRVEIAPAGSTAQTIDQEAFIVGRHDKLSLLNHLLKETEGPVLVFSRTKHGAKKITTKLNRLKHKSAEIHSNKSLNQRKEALAGFKSGKYRVLVATDIASRGIDVDNISLVVNYDVPDQLDDYVHRIGRTGRAGKSGKAVTFVAPEQKRELVKIERMIRMSIPTARDLPAGMEKLEASYSPRGGDRGPSPRSGGYNRSGSSYGRSKPAHRRSGGGKSKSYGSSDSGSRSGSGKSASGSRRSGGGRGRYSRKDVDYSARGEGAPIQNLPDQFRAAPSAAPKKSPAKKRSPGRKPAKINTRKTRSRRTSK